MLKNILMATAMATVLGSSVAGAQTYEFDHGIYTLGGCYQTKDGVRCDLNFTPNADNRFYWNTSIFQMIKPDGGNLNPSKVSAGGGNWTESTDYLNVYKSVPVRISILFDLPKTTTMMRILTVEGKRGDNIAVLGAAPAPTPPGSVVNVIKIDTTNFDAVMTNCKVTNNIIYCDAALTPKK